MLSRPRQQVILQNDDPTGAEAIQRRLSVAVDDLIAGRITAAEANRITAEARKELQRVGAALKAAELIDHLG